MLPRLPSDFATLPPEAWLIARVTSDREGLARLHAEVVALESEPTTWRAPSRTAYVQRLNGLGDELSRAIAATEALVLALHCDQENVRHALVFGS